MKKKNMKYTKRIITLVLTAAMVLGVIPPSVATAKTELEFIWLGKNGSLRVDTGLGNGTGIGDCWFAANDNADLGKSKVVWDQADPAGDGSSISDADVKKFGGISGTAILDKGELDYDPFVVICFNVVGQKSEELEPEEGDATGWGGISISYECDTTPIIQLGMSSTEDSVIGYANPEYTLAKAPAGQGVVESVPWGKFEQPGWAFQDSKITTDETVQKLVTVKFKIQGKSGSKFHFKISGIGSKDADLKSAIHSLTVVPAKAATCLEDGNAAYYKCEDCGKLFKDNTATTETTPAEVKIAATGHNWNEWTVIKAATETSAGTRIRICKNDPSHIETEDIPKLGSSVTGKEYMAADNSEPDQLKKNDLVADEKTGGKYKIDSVSVKNGKVTSGTVVFMNPYDPTAKTVVVKDTVTIGGVKFKITEISAKACKGNTTISKITIGKNVKKIGAGAFDGCSNLKNITIKTTKLTGKSVGKNAFRGIHKKAKAKVPGKKLKSYKSILKAKGMKGKNQTITK